MRLDAIGPRTWLLATVAGWALIAWVLALAGMGTRVATLPADASLQRPLPPLPRPAAPVLGPPGQYAAVAARPLFTSDRRPKAFVVAGLNAEGQQAPQFDYQLTSVLITPQVRLAILQSQDGSQSVRVKLGEAPEAQPGWRLVELDGRQAVFEGPEGRRTLELRSFDGKGGQPPTAIGGSTAAVNALPVPPPPEPGPVAEAGADAASPAEAQMEAIRRRIEQRRAALRQQQLQQQQQQQQPPQPQPAPPPPAPEPTP